MVLLFILSSFHATFSYLSNILYGKKEVLTLYLSNQLAPNRNRNSNFNDFSYLKFRIKATTIWSTSLRETIQVQRKDSYLYSTLTSLPQFFCI